MEAFSSLVLENYFLESLQTHQEHLEANQEPVDKTAYLKGFTLAEIVKIYWRLKGLDFTACINLRYQESSDSEAILQSVYYSTSPQTENSSGFTLCGLLGDFTTAPARRIDPYFSVENVFTISRPVLNTYNFARTKENLLTKAMYNIPFSINATCFGNANLNAFEEPNGYSKIFPISFFGKSANVYLNTFEPEENLTASAEVTISPQFYSDSDFEN